MSEPLLPPAAAPQLSPLKRAFLALEEAQERVRALEAGHTEPIAIIGVGCRIPGAESGPEDYWQLLSAASDAISAGVRGRFSGALGTTEFPASALRAGLLDAVDLFDPLHFGISPKEAVGIDPQQRLLLEVSWEALEHADIDPASLYQSRTGVYLGISSHDYAQLQLQSAAASGLNPHSASGAAQSVAAGRLSYFYGLNGPSIAVDTACSSSLVAVHLACEALRHGDCTAALAGGVNLILSPEPSIAFAQAGMLSRSGSVRAFDASADGFVRGEGCGVVVLKRLSEAERAGDRILAVVLGSAVNQDGASSGLTVPNGLAQQALLREAHRRAGIEPWQVGYVEAHGTGTALGDPIEAEALGAVFGNDQQRAAKLLLGSVKTNIGHLESAAGIAGLIKVVRALEHGILPPQLHFERPSEHLRWDELPLEIVTASRAWEPIAGRRIAGVSSFGFSGTNAHVVVEGWTRLDVSVEPAREDVLAISARTPQALRDLAQRYAAMLAEAADAWNAICFTAATGRAIFAERLAVVAANKKEAAAKLRLWLEDEAVKDIHRGQVGAGKRSSALPLGASASCAEVAAAFVHGEAVDWAGRFVGQKPQRVTLPTYPFQRERYWLEDATEKLNDQQSSEPTGRGMLGRRLRSAGVRGHFETTLEASGWIGEHCVEGRVVLPATGHLELMLEAAAELVGSLDNLVLEEVVLEAPLVVDGKRLVQVMVEEETSGRSRVRIYAQTADLHWQRVSEGWLVQKPVSQVPPALDLEALRGRLEPAPAGETFYANLAARGVDFGPRFRTLNRAWSSSQSGSSESLGEVLRPFSGGPGWELEPWGLDACLQAVALARGHDGNTDLYLPLSLERLEVFAASESDAGAATWSYVSLQILDSETLIAHLTLTDHHGQAIARLTNLRFRKLQERQFAAASLLYELTWQPKPLTAGSRQQELARIAAMLDESFDQFGTSEPVERYNSFFAELEELAAEYVLACFAELSWPALREARGWRIEELAALWRVIPRHRRLLGRMVEIAVEAGTVRRDGDRLLFGQLPSSVSVARIAAVRGRFPQEQTELDLVVRCGAALAGVLTGVVAGHELVFPAGESDQMAALYADSVPARIYNQMVAETIGRLLAGRTSASTSILEVGGGTGATTQYVLDALRAAGDPAGTYLFTDISPLLVRRAQARFQQHTSFQSQVFDLERPAESQGVHGGYSIILAVNVLHATSNLPATLGRLRSLLAPDGVLVAVEVVGRQRWADITVGLLDGWWSFNDAVRTDYPCLPSGAWRPLLEASGFQSVISIPAAAESNAESVFARQELLLARAPVAAKRVLMIGEGDFALLVGARLRSEGVLVDFAPAGQLVERLVESLPPDCVLWVAPPQPELDDSGAMEVSYRSLLDTARALTAFEGQRPPRLYIATTAAFAIGSSRERLHLEQATFAGMAAGIAMESPQLRCTRLDCSGALDESDAAFLCAEILSDSDGTWLAHRSGERYAARLSRLSGDAPKSSREILQFTHGGGIDSLEYAPSEQQLLGPNEVEIEVHATALNFRDVLQTIGAVDLKLPLGTDCAGVVVQAGGEVTKFAPGDEVVAIAPGAFASHIVASTALLARKPEELSFAQAAAQAVAYLTAYVALYEAGRLRRGDRVLIHAAAGGVGLAGVYLCRQMGAVPVATAGSEAKRAYLRGLGVEEVFDSRSCEFATEVREPVDLVLNSLAGPAIDAGLSLLKPGGRFLELGKTDLRDPELLGELYPGIEYISVDLTPAFAAKSAGVGELLSRILSEIASGSLAALPLSLFDAREVKQAFRYMARAEHIGRVVVQRRVASSITGTHLVTGGMRGIGLELAGFLAAQGASDLVLVGRNEPSPEARQRIAAIESSGTTVKLLMGDIGDAEVARRAIELCGPGLRGVWHCAGVLANASLESQTWESFQTVARPKVDGAWNLHQLTRKKRLDHFVLFSSWASIAGSTGQANHCAANAFLDALACQRRLDGLPGLSLNWGAWAESGAASSRDLQRQLQRSGMPGMSSKDALSAMQLALSSNLAQAGIAAIDWLRFLEQHPAGLVEPLYHSLASEATGAARDRSPRKTGIELSRESSDVDSKSRESQDDFSLETLVALPAAARMAALSQDVAAVVRKTLDLKPSEAIDPDLPLGELGMDSLLAIELRNRLNILLKRHLTSTLLFDHPTLRSLNSYLHGQIFSEVHELQALPIPVPLPAKPSPAGSQLLAQSGFELLDMIEQMTDQEVESSEAGF